MKKLTLILTTTLLFAAASSYAQEIETGKKGQMAILKLEFIVGNWVGTGSMMGSDGQKHSFKQRRSASSLIPQPSL